MKWLYLVVLATGCAPTLSAGYDASSNVRGSMRTMAPDMEQKPTYAFGAGLRSDRVGVEAGVQLRDELTTGSLEIRMRVLKTRYIAADLHAGPAAGAIIVDRMTPPSVGSGVRAGFGLAATLGHFNVFGDLNTTDLSFSNGPAAGRSFMTGLTLGIALR